MPRVVRVETPNEQNELKRLRQRVRQLEGLLADTQKVARVSGPVMGGDHRQDADATGEDRRLGGGRILLRIGVNHAPAVPL